MSRALLLSLLSLLTLAGCASGPRRLTWPATKWSEEKPATEFLQVPAPAARFIQYRLSFTSADGGTTAVVDEVDLAYAAPNLAPQIKSIKIATTAKPGADASASLPQEARQQTVTWDANDPNGDDLIYSLFFRSGPQASLSSARSRMAASAGAWSGAISSARCKACLAPSTSSR